MKTLNQQSSLKTGDVASTAASTTAITTAIPRTLATTMATTIAKTICGAALLTAPTFANALEFPKVERLEKSIARLEAGASAPAAIEAMSDEEISKRIDAAVETSSQIKAFIEIKEAKRRYQSATPAQTGFSSLEKEMYRSTLKRFFIAVRSCLKAAEGPGELNMFERTPSCQGEAADELDAVMVTKVSDQVFATLRRSASIDGKRLENGDLDSSKDHAIWQNVVYPQPIWVSLPNSNDISLSVTYDLAPSGKSVFPSDDSWPDMHRGFNDLFASMGVGEFQCSRKNGWLSDTRRCFIGVLNPVAVAARDLKKVANWSNSAPIGAFSTGPAESLSLLKSNFDFMNVSIEKAKSVARDFEAAKISSRIIMSSPKDSKPQGSTPQIVDMAGSFRELYASREKQRQNSRYNKDTTTWSETEKQEFMNFTAKVFASSLKAIAECSVESHPVKTKADAKGLPFAECSGAAAENVSNAVTRLIHLQRFISRFQLYLYSAIPESLAQFLPSATGNDFAPHDGPHTSRFQSEALLDGSVVAYNIADTEIQDKGLNAFTGSGMLNYTFPVRKYLYSTYVSDGGYGETKPFFASSGIAEIVCTTGQADQMKTSCRLYHSIETIPPSALINQAVAYKLNQRIKTTTPLKSEVIKVIKEALTEYANEAWLKGSDTEKVVKQVMDMDWNTLVRVQYGWGDKPSLDDEGIKKALIEHPSLREQ